MTTVVRVDERVDPRCAERDATCAYGSSRLAFRNLAFSLGDGRRILDDVSGSFSCGEMAAIMGPSGSGKTTLLDMLAGKKTTAYTGEVFLNGSPRDELFARLTSYVPQQDILPAHLTVYEAVRFVHELRVETAMSEREREEAILQTLELLGLRRGVANRLCRRTDFGAVVDGRGNGDARHVSRGEANGRHFRDGDSSTSR
jgi:ATP-binding cassette subfamily G (WHITE) protein 2